MPLGSDARVEATRKLGKLARAISDAPPLKLVHVFSGRMFSGESLDVTIC